MRFTRGWLLVAAVAVALVGPATLEAQRGPGGAERERLEQRVRAQMARVMRERLGLGEDEAARLGEIVEEFDAERRQIFREEQATRRRVEALMLEGGTDEEEAAGLVEAMIDLRRREAELFAAEQDALSEVLAPTQLLRFQTLREQLGRRIRALRGERGQGPAGPRRRGGGMQGEAPGRR